MSKINVLLFDIGNVLIGWDQASLLNKVFEVSGVQDTPELRALFKAWNDAWDSGSMRELSQKQIEDYPAYAAAIRAYCEYWPISLKPVIEESFDIVQEAKRAGYRLYTASNFSSDNFETTLPRLPRLALFDAVHISCTFGICKPNPLFWTDMMQRFDFCADEAFFIDDRHDNVEAATKLGIASHLFETPQKLRADLKARQIL
ncbi:MAG: HAD-IA family hydrolase [Alphaproteobacteria bacterium]|nr:HAD-IA family hydrolase [Alphaproteobacteria bacterium]